MDLLTFELLKEELVAGASRDRIEKLQQNIYVIATF